MASMHEIRPGVFKVRYRVDGKPRSKTIEGRTAAKRFKASIEGRHVEGTLTDPSRGRIPTGEWADEWFTKKAFLRPTTQGRIKSVIDNHVKPRFEDTPLVSVSSSSVQAWVADMLDDGLSAATIRKNFDVLNGMMRVAASPGERRIPFNPCEGTALPPSDRREQRFLDLDEMDALTRAMDEVEPRFVALVLLGAYGGLRFGELAGLKRSRIDFLRGRVLVRETLTEVNGHRECGPPKTKRSIRDVPLASETLAALERHLERYVAPLPGAYVFTTPKGDLLYRGSFRRNWWLPATRKAGLDGLRVHDMRHTFVSFWAEAGWSIAEVSKAAGHSSVAFTQDRYQGLYEKPDEEVRARLDALLAAKRSLQDASLTRPGRVSNLHE